MVRKILGSWVVVFFLSIMLIGFFIGYKFTTSTSKHSAAKASQAAKASGMAEKAEIKNIGIMNVHGANGAELEGGKQESPSEETVN